MITGGGRNKSTWRLREREQQLISSLAWLPRKHLADAMAPGHEAMTELSGREVERELNSIELEDK